MTKLSTLRKINNVQIMKSKVEHIEAITIYYVYTGRNAWHSTWVTQYTEGCMHSTLQSAKAYAETKRIQGTVLNISDLPALHIYSSVGSIVVTQINTKVPLKDYSRSAVRESHQCFDLIENYLNDYLVAGATIHGVVLSFDFDSRFWRSPPPVHNSTIIVTPSEKTFEFSISQNTNKRRRSISYGGSYTLGWKEQDTDISSNAVQKLLEFQPRNDS